MSVMDDRAHQACRQVGGKRDVYKSYNSGSGGKNGSDPTPSQIHRHCREGDPIKKQLFFQKRVRMRACACLKRERERVQGNAATPRMFN